MVSMCVFPSMTLTRLASLTEEKTGYLTSNDVLWFAKFANVKKFSVNDANTG